jgi:hypothetical protein
VLLGSTGGLPRDGCSDQVPDAGGGAADHEHLEPAARRACVLLAETLLAQPDDEFLVLDPGWSSSSASSSAISVRKSWFSA